MKHTHEFQFSNGDKVREKVSGFTGIITGSVFYLTGCNQYLISAKPKNEHSEPVAIWYDEGRIEIIKENVIPSSQVTTESNGCDKLPPVR